LKQNFPRFQKTTTLIALGLSISSCGRDIPSLQKVEKAVDNLNVAAVDISEDMYKSCIRATQFFGTPGSPTLLTERQPEEKFCDENYLKISAVTENANAVLINYMNSLVLVAKGESEKGKLISFHESYKNLEDSLINLKFSSSRTAAPQAVFKEAEVKAGVAMLFIKITTGS
jgi:hypothetical protein